MSHFNWILAGGTIGVSAAAPIAIVNTLKEIETAMAGMNQVIDHKKLGEEAAALGVDKHTYAQQKLNEETKTFIDLAAVYGEKTNDIIEAGKLWGRLYKDLETVNVLTGQSAKLAVADNFNLIEANRALEAAMFQYGLTAKNSTEAMAYSGRIIDVWTKLAHTAGASAQDLTAAVERTGSVAKLTGVDFEFLNAMIATAVRSTGRSGAEIGNMFKSVLGSIHSTKAIKEIEALGVAVYKVGSNGQKEFRKAQDVLLDIAVAAQGTTQNLEDLYKAVSGGKFQWAKTAAMLGDYKEFIRTWGEAVNSTGFTAEQVGMQLDTIGRKMQTLKADIEGLVVNGGNAGLTQWIKDAIGSVDAFIVTLRKIPVGFWEATGAAAKYSLYIFTFIGLTKLFRNAIATLTLAKRAQAIATATETAANISNTVATEVGTVATAARTVATNSAAVATGKLALLTTLATGGLNLLAAGTVLALGATYKYASSLGEEEKAHRAATLQRENSIAQKQQEIEMYKQQVEFTDSLIAAYQKIQAEIDSGTLSTEKYELAIENRRVTEEQLTNVLGEAAVERIRQAGWTQDAYNKEKDAFVDAQKKKKIELQKMVNAQIQSLNEEADIIKKKIANYYEDAERFGDSVALKIKWLGILKTAMLEGYEIYTGWNEKKLDLAHDVLAKAQQGMNSIDPNDNSEEANMKREEYRRQYASGKIMEQTAKDNIAWSQKQGAKILNDPVAEMKEEVSKKEKKKIDLFKGGPDYTPPGAGGNTVPPEVDKITKGRGGTTPSDPKAKLERNLLKMEKDSDFMKAKLSADRYAESLSNLSLLQSIYGDTVENNNMKQAVMRDRVVELSKENERYQSVISNLDAKISGIVDSDGELIKSLGVTQDAWNKMGNDDKRAFLIQRRDMLETSDTLKNLVMTLNDYNEKSSGTKKKITEINNEMLKMNFAGVFDKEKIYQRRMEEIDFNEKEQKDAIYGREYDPTYNEQIRQIELIALYDRQVVQKERLNDLEEERAVLEKGMPAYIEYMNDKLAEQEEYERTLAKIKLSTQKEYVAQKEKLAQLKQSGADDKAILSAEAAAKEAYEKTTIAAKEYAEIQQIIVNMKQYIAAAENGDTDRMHELESSIRKQTEALKGTNNEITKTKDKFKDVRSAGADVFSDLIVQGNSFKDVWKRLWNELANDAIKALFRVQNSNHGLLSSLIGIFSGGIGGGSTKGVFDGWEDGLVDRAVEGMTAAAKHRGGKITADLPKMHTGGVVLESPTLKDDEVVRTLQVGERVLSKEDNTRFEFVMPRLMEAATKGPTMVPALNPEIMAQTRAVMADSQQTKAQIAEMQRTNELLTSIIQNMATKQENGGGNVVVLNSTDTAQVIQMVPQGLGQAVMQYMNRQGALGRGNFRA